MAFMGYFLRATDAIKNGINGIYGVLFQRNGCHKSWHLWHSWHTFQGFKYDEGPVLASRVHRNSKFS